MSKKITMLKIVCPYCGFYWRSDSTPQDLASAMHDCDYCKRKYRILPNITEKREY